MLKPWHKNNLKRLNKSPKLHYLDPGIQQAILRKKGPLTGSEYESAVFSEILKQTKQFDFQGDLFHLRTSDGREVDLLIEFETGYIAIEIKMTSHVGKADARNLKNLSDILDKPLIISFILSNDLSIKKITPDIIALPAAMFLT